MTGPSTPRRKEADAHAAGWLWLLPRLSFVLFIAAVAALLWLSERADKEEQRATLISDMLWLEQNLRFVLEHNEELLGQIGPRQARDPASFEAHAHTLTGNQTGLVRVLWLDSSGTVLAGTSGGTEPDREAARLALTIGKPVYGGPYDAGREHWQFDVHVPVFSGGNAAGIVIGSYSLRRMLEESVPWWLAERYRIVVVDAGGKVFAARTKVEAPTGEGGYQLAFDPPGRGLALEAVPYRVPQPLAGRLLSAALVVLAVAVLWSMWALRRHTQRRLAAEQALREEHAFRKAMEDSVQTGLRARDLEGRITYVNPAFCAMVGWSAEELIGRKPPMPYWVDEQIEATRALHDRILAGEGPERGFEVSFKRRNGEVFPVLIHEAPLIDAGGRQTGWMSSVIDISDQRRAAELARQQEERLQATQRLIAMGEMASSLAHELNQPLAAIAGYNAGCLNMLSSGNANLADVEDALGKSTEQAQRAGRIIRRIYEFVRRAEPKSEPCDLVTLIDEVIGLVEPDARRQGMRIQREIDALLPPVQGDRVLLGQVVLNLIRNGIDAMRDVAPERRNLSIAAEGEADQVHLRIADHGHGIPPDVAARLFEPFFTTKAEGMGMGLNICRSVVEGHKGRLWIDPNPEGGSIVHVLLPTRRR
ncbi:MAG: PAS domain S-box protein [Rhodocyclales bacterium]|nr:PAS domain S-box protein [Rhodocyclales bacterium]MBI5781495.1 PAS domain S-box protein [Rhodocyclales bacterium]